ncbi:MAG: branched-chain alpha-keto acid dehydrogenase subunit [Paenibacillaceae bacterium]|jgi:2-oxoisovalerate dehydrogenase E2 component (dihydrolipoyl transacylase)|nr:branched-chain alpha-keto acid dehydrogenase subunit [Paenibacillaceae bacterium]
MKQAPKGTEVQVPHLAESLVSATVGKWLKKPGDYVQQYDALCELITEKVNVEMPSPVEGTLLEILVEEGRTAAVGEAICLVAEPGAEVAESVGVRAEHSGAGRVSGSAGGVSSIHETADRFPASAGGTGARYSPAVLTLAAEHRLDLSQIPGTGLGGRITRKDVLHYIEAGMPVRQTAAVAGTEGTAAAYAALDVYSGSGAAPQQGAAPRTEASNAQAETPLHSLEPVRTTGIHLSQEPAIPAIPKVVVESGNQREYYVDVTPIRNTIASRMRQSVAEIPHAWTMIEVDVTNLVVLRSKLKDEFARREGINLTYLPFLIKAVVNAIKDYPIINSVWAVDKIIVKRDINISLAVGTEDSVLTPVIKKADQKNIAGLAQEMDDLGKKARAGKLSLDDMTGGTFTVNNTGSFGSILSYPIINYPQAAILTFESIVKKPVVINDMIAVRSMVNLCLSLDHRILDGVICGRFLQRVKENLEGYSQDTKLY